MTTQSIDQQIVDNSTKRNEIYNSIQQNCCSIENRCKQVTANSLLILDHSSNIKELIDANSDLIEQNQNAIRSNTSLLIQLQELLNENINLSHKKLHLKDNS